jgi:hypothetical protein
MQRSRLMRRTCGLLVVGLWGTYVVASREKGQFAPLPFVISKETTGILRPLRPEGTVDYLKALNEKYGKGVTAEKNAFVGWLEVVGTGDSVFKKESRAEVLKLCGAKESVGMGWKRWEQTLKEAGLKAEAEKSYEPVDFAVRNLWAAEEFPRFAKYLEDQGKVLDAVKAAFARERYYSPYVGREAGFVMNSGHSSMGRLSEMSRFLAARATLRAKAGDFDGFLSDVEGVMRIAQHVGSGATTLEWMVGNSVQRLGLRAIGVAAGRELFTRGQLERLGKLLDGMQKFPSAAERVDVFERWCMLDTMAFVAMRGEPVEGEFELYRDELYRGIERESVDWNVVLKELNGIFDRMREAFRPATMEGLDEAWKDIERVLKGDAAELTAEAMGKRAGETREDYSKRVARSFAAMLASLGAMEQWARGAEMEKEMVRALVAAGEYRRVHGKWPAGLGDVVPAFLKKLPKDIYSEKGEKDVLYEVKAEGVRVWSVGPKRGEGKRKEIGVGVK